MDWLIFGAIAIVAIIVLVIAQRRGWIDFTNKSQGRGSANSMGMFDEVFAPSRFEAQAELDRQTVLPAPAPVAGDGDKGIFKGTVRIDLDDETGRR